MSSEGRVTVEFNPTGELLEATLACERDVFLEAFGNTPAQLEEEYGPYAEQSRFITVVDDYSGQVIAQSRMILPGPMGLKTVNDVSRAPWGVDGVRALKAAGMNPDRMVDVATMGVRKEARGAGSMALMALLHTYTAMGLENDGGAVGIMDEGILRVVAMVGHHWTTIPGCKPAPYLGSPASTPVFVWTSSYVARQRRENPEAYRLLTLGLGLDNVNTVPRDRLRLPELAVS